MCTSLTSLETVLEPVLFNLSFQSKQKYVQYEILSPNFESPNLLVYSWTVQLILSQLLTKSRLWRFLRYGHIHGFDWWSEVEKSPPTKSKSGLVHCHITLSISLDLSNISPFLSTTFFYNPFYTLLYWSTDP